jgi:hippurate hydrolase
MLVTVVAVTTRAQSSLDASVGKQVDGLVATYKHLHEHPELSGQEKETSALIASELKKAGFEVTDHFGKYDDPGMTAYGVVGIMKNGPGPIVMVRTDMDALPVFENTGLPYASKVKVRRADGVEVGVIMHAVTIFTWRSFSGPRVLAETRNLWSGTVVLLGQPAEETIGGAKAVLAAGLYDKFPVPNYVLAFHDTNVVEAGKVAWIAGTVLAGSDSLDITVRGYGGHGAMPQATRDPILIASEIVVMLQSVISRERDPLEPAVVTVGSFHSGTKHNIIPDEAHLQLTVRTMNPASREKTLAAITRIVNGVSAAAGVPAERAPVITVSKDNVPATINDAEFTKRGAEAMRRAIGNENVIAGLPIMASEDFSLYALAPPRPPTTMFWLGASDPALLRAAVEKGHVFPACIRVNLRPCPSRHPRGSQSDERRSHRPAKEERLLERNQAGADEIERRTPTRIQSNNPCRSGRHPTSLKRSHRDSRPDKKESHRQSVLAE